jgi:ligand-binding sensor domain-containing protein
VSFSFACRIYVLILLVFAMTSRLWACGGGEILVPPPDLTHIAPASVEVLLHGLNVRCLLPGKEGLWAGTEGRGLAFLKTGSKSWTFYQKAEQRFPEDTVVRLARFQGELWLAFPGGVGRFVPERYQPAAVPGSPAILDMAVWRDHLYVLTEAGLFSTTGEGFAPVTLTGPGAPQGAPASLHAGSDGRLWLGTEDAELGAFDGQAWTRLSFKGKLPGRVVRAICPAGHQLWFGTFGSLGMRDETTNRLEDETTEKAALFPSRIISSIQAAGDTVLFGTSGGGLYRLDRAKDRWRQYNETNGLPANDVNAIHVEGSLAFVATSKGLARVDLSAPLALAVR